MRTIKAQSVANALLLIWLVVELLQIRKSRHASGSVQDAGTFYGMWWTLAITVVLGNLLLMWTHRHTPPLFRMPSWTAYAGLGMILAGILFRWYAIKYLGRYFTVRVTIQDQQPLIQTGPYRWLRHPSYTGAWMALVGTGLVAGTWPVLLVWAFVPLVSLLRRIHVEESVLSAHFGDAYEAYRRRTWCLIPWVY